jgi:hypothetical protein
MHRAGWIEKWIPLGSAVTTTRPLTASVMS